MWSLIFYLPCFACRAIESVKNKRYALAGLLEDFFVVTLTLQFLSFLPKGIAIVLWSLIGPLFLLGWYFPYRLEIPLSWNVVSFLRNPSSFFDSARALKLGLPLAAGGILFLPTYLGFGTSPPIFLLVAGLLALFFPSRNTENPFFAFLRHKKKEKAGEYSWNFPHEVFTFISPEFPLLRKTAAFKGKKRFSISLERPNVVFLFLESFRAKNVGCLGAEIPASPCFDKLAEKGVLFTRFFANGVTTSQSFISAFFSVPSHLESMSLKPYHSIPLIGLPSILKENGYRTALMQGGSTSFDWSYPFFQMHGFDEIVGKEDFSTPHKTSWGVADEILYESACHWMERQNTPYFLSLFTISNHHPWGCPSGWHFSKPPFLSSEYGRYLETFSYSDHALGAFFERAPKRNTIFFVFGDHGQAMGEHGSNFVLHNSLYQENIHVPLLIIAEGLDPARIPTPSSHVDLLPTVLDLLDLPAVHHSVGRSLVREANSPLFISRPKEIGCVQEDWKFIDPDLLYHLPDETRNLAPSPLLQSLKVLTHSYFHTVESLYLNKTWAPHKLSVELLAPADATMEEWMQILSDKTSASLVRLSNTRLPDQALFAIGGENGANIHEIDLSHSLFSDKALAWIGAHCPNLRVLNLSYCPLITEAGLCALNRCAKLRHLVLEGQEDLENPLLPSSLQALDLRLCRKFKGPLEIYPLVHIAASLASLPKTHFFSLKGLLYAWLSDGDQIDDEALQIFYQNNPSLLILILEDFSLLTKLPPFSLQILKIVNCEHLRSMENVSAKKVSIVNCPNLRDG